MVEHDLVPDGRRIKVTDGNKADYVNAYVRWRLATSVKEQLQHMVEGLHEVVPPGELSVFAADEMDYLLNGRGGVTVSELQLKARYTGGFSAHSYTVKLFWDAVHDFSQDFRSKLLRFVTGSSKVPLDGFHPDFTLTKAAEPKALPRSHTCFNQLVLPGYTSLKKLKDGLITAVENTEGFYLT